jgi:hypothetical protein
MPQPNPPQDYSGGGDYIDPGAPHWPPATPVPPPRPYSSAFPNLPYPVGRDEVITPRDPNFGANLDPQIYGTRDPYNLPYSGQAFPPSSGAGLGSGYFWSMNPNRDYVIANPDQPVPGRTENEVAPYDPMAHEHRALQDQPPPTRIDPRYAQPIGYQTRPAEYQVDPNSIQPGPTPQPTPQGAAPQYQVVPGSISQPTPSLPRDYFDPYATALISLFLGR